MFILRFYLYLYGIEIVLTSSMYLTFLVLLVPLWNWNDCKNLMGTELWWFYLYLYGIEIQKPLCGKGTRRVLLVPLWNWNRVQLQRNWQLLTVLLVPLWNWNIHEALRCIRIEPFYLYLYGIEMRVRGQYL